MKTGKYLDEDEKEADYESGKNKYFKKNMWNPYYPDSNLCDSKYIMHGTGNKAF